MKLNTVATLAAVTLALTVSTVAAQSQYPARAVKLVVPLTASSAGDILARAIAGKASETFGQPIVVENRPGDTMNIGAQYVAKSAPDGYTLLLAGSAMMIHPAMRARMPYDNLQDFAPISLVGSFPLVLLVNPQLPIKSVSELIGYARKRGELHFGSPGAGGTIHLAGVMLGLMGGVRLVHVPYRGVPETLTDVIGGRIEMAFAGAPQALPLAASGKIRVLATTGLRRTATAPDLPTIAEAGLPDFNTTVWFGVWAPAGTPPAVVSRWHAELVRILQTQEIKERWLALGTDPVSSATPAEFAAMIRAEMNQWAKVVKESGAKVE